MEAVKYLKKLILLVFVFLFIAAGIVVVVDPFFHYHAPVFKMKAVQTKKEYQVGGALEHLDYNAILLGSSVAMNVNNRELDEIFGCRSIKAVGSNASVSLLCYYMNKAFENRQLDYVFWSFDPFSLDSELVKGDTDEDQILYLKNKNPIDDVYYLWNMDVLFKEVPKVLLYSYVNEYDEGTSYEFAKYSTFEKRAALNAFYDLKGARTESLLALKEAEVPENAKQSVLYIDEIVKAHPDTQFVFFLAPYSILWWDVDRRDSDTLITLEEIGYAVSVLAENDNVIFYKGLFNDEDIIMNLDNYTDWVHASSDTYHKNLQTIAEDTGRITADNVEEELNKMLNMVIDFENRVDEEGYEFLAQ